LAASDQALLGRNVFDEFHIRGESVHESRRAVGERGGAGWLVAWRDSLAGGSDGHRIFLLREKPCFGFQES
jgi:hypothetical protein